MKRITLIILLFVLSVRADIVDVSRLRSINQAITALGTSAQRTLVVSNAQTLTANLIVPSNIKLIIQGGGSITHNGRTLHINGPFEGIDNCFVGFDSSDVDFGVGSVEAVDPAWFGLTATSSKAANLAALYNAVGASRESRVRISIKAGTYRIADVFKIPSYTTLDMDQFATLMATTDENIVEIMGSYITINGGRFDADSVGAATYPAATSFTRAAIYMGATSNEYINLNNNTLVGPMTAVYTCDTDADFLAGNQAGGKGLYIRKVTGPTDYVVYLTVKNMTIFKFGCGVEIYTAGTASYGFVTACTFDVATWYPNRHLNTHGGFLKGNTYKFICQVYPSEILAPYTHAGYYVVVGGYENIWSGTIWDPTNHNKTILIPYGSENNTIILNDPDNLSFWGIKDNGRYSKILADGKQRYKGVPSVLSRSFTYGLNNHFVNDSIAKFQGKWSHVFKITNDVFPSKYGVWYPVGDKLISAEADTIIITLDARNSSGSTSKLNIGLFPYIDGPRQYPISTDGVFEVESVVNDTVLTFVPADTASFFDTVVANNNLYLWGESIEGYLSNPYDYPLSLVASENRMVKVISIDPATKVATVTNTTIYGTHADLGIGAGDILGKYIHGGYFITQTSASVGTTWTPLTYDFTSYLTNIRGTGVSGYMLLISANTTPVSEFITYVATDINVHLGYKYK